MSFPFPSARIHRAAPVLVQNDELRRLKHECHKAYDQIWKTAGAETPGQPISRIARRQRRSLFQKVRIIVRFYMADRLGVTEAEVQISRMTDVALLKSYVSAATGITIKSVNDWWEVEGKARHGLAYREAVQQAREVRIWGSMEKINRKERA